MTRTILPRGPHQCQSCGCTGRHNGPYWGGADLPPRCDACEFAAKVRADFADDPASAEQIHCVARYNVERYLARELRGRYH